MGDLCRVNREAREEQTSAQLKSQEAFEAHNKRVEEKRKKPADDKVNHPKHYNSHPSGIECIDVVEHLNFNIGNAIKYLWRTDHKNGIEDLKKAEWYIRREIERLEGKKS